MVRVMKSRSQLRAAGGGVLAAVEDDLQVELVPLVLWEEPLGVALGLLHVLPVGEIPAVHQAVDVGVDREGRDAEGLRHDHRRRLVPHAGEALKGFHVLGDGAAVLVHQDLAQADDGLGLLRAEAARPDDLAHLVHRHVAHVLGVVGPGKEGRGDLVDPGVRALRAEQHRHQQRVGVGMVERNRHFRIEPLELVHHPLHTGGLRGQIEGGQVGQGHLLWTWLQGIFALDECTAIRPQHGGRRRPRGIPAPPRRGATRRHHEPPLA